MVEKDKVCLVGDKSGNLDPERRNQRSSKTYQFTYILQTLISISLRIWISKDIEA